MPLTTAELDRIRTECGVNALLVGAEPYIGVAAVFEQVIQPFLREGADTTGLNQVDAANPAAVTTIMLQSATGFGVHDQVVIDVDDFEEKATIRGLVTGGISVILKQAHTPPYPVTVDGGLVVVRECLRWIREAKAKISRFNPGAGPLKKVDEIEFHAPGNKTAVGTAQEMLALWRKELAIAIGLEGMLRQKRGGGGGGMVPY
jgi:hypothetical protein